MAAPGAPVAAGVTGSLASALVESADFVEDRSWPANTATPTTAAANRATAPRAMVRWRFMSALTSPACRPVPDTSQAEGQDARRRTTTGPTLGPPSGVP